MNQQTTVVNSAPPTPSLIAMSDIDALKAAGILWPKTKRSWEWTYARRAENGLAGAFSKVGRRILVDPVRFVELVRGRR